MVRRRRGRKLSVYKPHKHGLKWRIQIRDGVTGEVAYQKYDSEKAAEQGYRRLKREAARFEMPTVGEMMTNYRVAKLEQGNKPESVRTTDARLEAFFGAEVYNTPVGLVMPKDLQARYDERRKYVAPDTSRNEIAQTKTFFRWVIEQGLIKTNPAEGLNPALAGKRRKGKKQLRPSEAKIFLDHTIALARKGDDAALACAMTLLLGLRASELLKRTVRDVDKLTHTLHIDSTKTEAGERVLEIPDVIWPMVVTQTDDKLPMAPLFYARGESGFHYRQWLCVMGRGNGSA